MPTQMPRGGRSHFLLQLAHICSCPHAFLLRLLDGTGADRCCKALGPALLMWFGVKTTWGTAAHPSQALAAGKMMSGMHGAAR
jgi:hypothetical protein